MTATTIGVGDIVAFDTAKLPRGARFVKVYRDSSGGFRWRLRYQDKVLSDSGQAYRRRPTALAAARQNAIPAGTFPVIIEYHQYRGSKLVLVWERVR